MSASRKEQSHERIVDAAARAIRRAGYSGVGVADVMKEAGLTHGGFYAHFPSRDALLAAAMERAGQDGAARLSQNMARRRAEGASPLRAWVEAYLSDAHLAGCERGCPVAALASEIPRQSDDVREVAASRVQRLMEAVQQVLPAQAGEHAAAAVLSTLVGALQLARALGDNPRGRAVLASARRAVLDQYDQEAAATAH
ncbi:TetR/AcrR family transcriptional regulator [Achromobacter mucicolens]|uniref:TetR/AcrR family transcriptional regulator n=1 Tax=Achromobacter mucicolens TaxID=1389922 RepID=UPI0007C69777|nr:TetR/AcrR family transcriptional regulator [Achromobacter mucicolens]OAE62651.1 TetR family transcriptional regulator [Achromobacter xylosoxidans]PTW83661.1 TetR/AcrR family transcriptional regulator [Achromobacter mucicolens]